MSAFPAYDVEVSAFARLLWMSGDSEKDLQVVGVVPHADVAAASYAVAAIPRRALPAGADGIGACFGVPITAATRKLAGPLLAEH